MPYPTTIEHLKAIRAKRASAGTNKAARDKKAREDKVQKEKDKADEKVKREKDKIEAKEFMRIHRKRT